VTATARFLREQQGAILQEWLRRVEALPDAVGMPEPMLRDNLPAILTEIAERLERPGESHLDALPSIHAIARYKVGFDVRSVVSEYAILRQVLIELRGAPLEAEVHALLDLAVAVAVDHFALERDRQLETFIAILGHDLRNPLNAIGVAAQHLLSIDGRPPPERRMLVRIGSATGRIERMVSDLLDLARGRLGSGIPITPVPVDLAQLVHDVADEFVDAYPDRTIRVDGATHVQGVWDADRLAQVVSNLIANALEHGEDPVVARALDHGDRVAIEVCNGGMIDLATASRVWDPFVSIAGPREGRRGLGLGLYIVREIARAHRGTVEVTRDDGVTVFRVVLPRQPSGAAAGTGGPPR
jgi:signal transduction histidine kinase